MNCFKTIAETNSKMDGWCTLAKATTLAALVVALRPKVSVEIGVYAGRSLIPLALAHKEVGGYVIGIDPWTVEAATEGYDKTNADWWGRPDNLNRVKAETFKWIQMLDLQSCCQIVQAKSDDADVPQDLELLHVDSQHSEVAIREVKKFSIGMKSGSIIVMDDIDWTNNGVAHVAKAVGWIEMMGWEKLYNLETGAVFRRK